MRKVWVYKRKNRPGVYVRWYGDDGRQKSRRLPNEPAARLFQARMQHEINTELYHDVVDLPWAELLERYLTEKQYVQGVAEGTLISIRSLLSNVGRLCGELDSSAMDQGAVKGYVAARAREGSSPATINKDLRTLHALVRWGLDQGYMGQAARQIKWRYLRRREPAKAVKALTLSQFARLLATAERLYGLHWRIRLLFAIGTGLRLNDIERLTVEDLDLEGGSLLSRSKKTGKAIPTRPLHPRIVLELAAYLKGRRSGRILQDRYHHTKWQRIRTAARLPWATYHNLRKTFGSFLAQAGFSTAVVQDLLEHSTPHLTQQIYLDVSPEYRRAAQAIPIERIMAEADGPARAAASG